jgi:hypothetical protein
MDSNALREVFRGKILRQSMLVAVAVGTIFNLIDQWHLLLDGGFHFVRGLVIYAVPFLVASFGAYSAISERAPMD